MGDVRNEVATDRLQPPNPGEILQHNQVARRSTALQWGDHGIQQILVENRLHHPGLFFPRVIAAIPEVNKLVTVSNLGKTAPKNLVAITTEDTGGCSVNHHDRSLLIRHHDAVGHMIEHRRQTRPLEVEAPRPSPVIGRPYD